MYERTRKSLGVNAKELKCIIKYERNFKACAANSAPTFIVMNGRGWRGHARKSTCLVIYQGHVCTATWIPGWSWLWVMQYMETCVQITATGADQKSELKLSYNPWLFPMCLPRSTCTPHLPAPGTAQLHTSNPLAVMLHLLQSVTTAPLDSVFSFVLLIFFWICRE